MQTIFQTRLSRGVLAALTFTTAAAPGASPVIPMSPMVVTGHHSDQPLIVTADPQAPAQPIPAQDGAEILRNIAGFSVIRKGGTDGDPVLRGMAGSRLGIVVDGALILGGCGNRMDPPTAYVHPAAFDRVIVLKGPETVLHGPGFSAGVVSFERNPRRFARPDHELAGSATFGSFSRNDQALRFVAGTPAGYVEANATRSASGDYQTGSGETVHSGYKRWNVQAAAGLTPGERTLLEASAALSDGEAAYADRAMDGVTFAREHFGLRVDHRPLAGTLARIEVRAYHNYVDHVMDNFSLRSLPPAGSMRHPAVSNPDRKTLGGRALARLSLANRWTVDVGIDSQSNRHTIRSTTDEVRAPHAALPRSADALFRQGGVFAELALPAGGNARAIAGLRADDWLAKDRRASVGNAMSGLVPNPTAGARRHESLEAGFLRLEHEREGNTSYVGLGHAARFPDYWEMFSKESAASASAFHTRPERTAQIDAGVIARRNQFTGSVSLFASRIQNFILIQSGVRKGMRTVTIARNVDASSLGGEATASLEIASRWKADVSITHVRGENRTDDRPLAQQPPLEGRVALAYSQPQWSIGALARLAAAQDRVAVNQGNIAGQDIAASDGFTVLSLNGAWSFPSGARLAAGIDNVFDRAYAEHISRAGSTIPGYTQISRVSEPGRTIWVKLDVAY